MFRSIAPGPLLLAAGALLGWGPIGPPRVSAQESPLDRLSVHGFLTQAYGISDEHQRLGIRSDGTADYRVAALQFRYDREQDAFVLQLSHERLAHSPLSSLEPQVDLDWIFYERRFGENTTARVGKIRSPVGIYNEIRDVGTLLPLYRPPTAVYSEQFYSSETVDGLMVAQRVPMGDWTVELDAFAGGWSYVQWDLRSRAHIDDGVGLQVWLQTPLPGLRIGGAAMHYTVKEILGAPEEFEDPQTLWMASVDGMFAGFFTRAEGYYVGYGAESAGYTGWARGYYAQAGFQVVGPLSLVGEAQFTDLALELHGSQPFSFEGTTDRDLAVALRYQPSPFIAVKLELHGYEGYGIEDEVRTIGVSERASMMYGLLSVSTSF